jgi:hypothetical protein
MDEAFGKDKFDQVVQVLRLSGLILPLDETLHAFQNRPESEQRYPTAVTDLGYWLIGRGLLTHWQFAMLCQAKSKGFFLDGYKLLDHLDGRPGDGHYVAERIATGVRVLLCVTGSIPVNTAPSTVSVVHEFH